MHCLRNWTRSNSAIVARWCGKKGKEAFKIDSFEERVVRGSLARARAMKTYNAFRKFLFRRKLSNTVLILGAIIAPAWFLSWVSGDELPLQKQAKWLRLRLSAQLHAMWLGISPDANKAMKHSTYITILFLKDLKEGYYDADFAVSVIDNNSELIRDYGFLDIRAVNRALDNSAQVLYNLQDKKMYVLPKEKELKDAYMRLLEELKKKVSDNFYERADKLVSSSLGIKDPNIREFWQQYGNYIGLVFLASIMVLPLTPVNVHDILSFLYTTVGSNKVLYSSIVSAVKANVFTSITDYVKLDKILLLPDLMKLVNLMLDNPKLSIELLNHKYISTLIYSYLELGPTSRQIADNVKPLLVHLIKVVKDNKDVKRYLDWALMRKETKIIKEEMKGQGKELEGLAKELESIVERAGPH